jgi:type IV pilus assembly protein PilM
LKGRIRTGQLPIGLDLGATEVRAVQLRYASGESLELVATAHVLPPDTPPAGPERCAKVSAVLRKMLSERRFSGSQVVASIPNAEIEFRTLRVPAMPPAELATAVQFQAANRLQLKPQEHELQFFDVCEVVESDQKQRELLIMAAHRAAVEEQVRTLVSAGLQPVALDAGPCALARVFTAPPAAGSGRAIDTQPLVLVDIGYRSTTVTIAQNGAVCLVRRLDSGGQRLDDALAAKLGVSPSAAAAIRRGETPFVDAQNGGDASSALRAVNAVTETVAAVMARELAMLTGYYSKTFRQRQPATVLLFGREAGTPGLGDAMTRLTGMDCRVAAAWPEHTRSRLPHGYGDATDPSRWALPLGLSFYTVDQQPQEQAA